MKKIQTVGLGAGLLFSPGGGVALKTAVRHPEQIIVSMQTTLDGFITGTNGEIDRFVRLPPKTIILSR